MHVTYAIHAHRDFSIGAVSPALSTTSWQVPRLKQFLLLLVSVSKMFLQRVISKMYTPSFGVIARFLPYFTYENTIAQAKT